MVFNVDIDLIYCISKENHSWRDNLCNCAVFICLEKFLLYLFHDTAYVSQVTYRFLSGFSHTVDVFYSRENTSDDIVFYIFVTMRYSLDNLSFISFNR